MSHLNILCLHGRRQTGNIFEKRLETTIRRLRTQAESLPDLEWSFIDAPFLCDDLDDNEGQRTWWKDSSDESTYFSDLQTSLQVLEKALNKTSFDFILSFSQGCALVAEASAAGILDKYENLSCLIFAGGLVPSLFVKPSTPMLSNVSTLHFAGTKDKVVLVAKSKLLSKMFANAVFIEHSQGHCFPSQASNSQSLIKFLEEKYNAASFTPSEDLLDELEALQSIYTPEELTIIDPNTKQLSVRIKNRKRTIELIFRFKKGYPEKEKSLTLTTGDLINCTKKTVRGALNMAHECMSEQEGEPLVFAIVQAVQDYLDAEEEGGGDNDGDDKDMNADCEKKSSSKNHSRGKEEKKKPVLNATSGAITPEVLSLLTKEACIRLKTKHDDDHSPRRRKKMYWGDFTVGLVGKPSAGKSTFFNACKTLGTNAARVGSFPFTTIEPNVGRAAVRFTWPTVVQTKNRTFEMEIFIKDVAGLVKGAYRGRGRGNSFLDDLCGADVLVHVLDGSGDTDEEGNSSSGTGNPADEIEWVYAEIHQWISDNVLSKWQMVTRKNTREAIGSLFTGYRSVKEDVDRSASLAGLLIEDNKAKGGRKDFVDWKKEDVHRLVAHFLRLRFPIIIGFNKCDDDRSVQHLKSVEEKYKHEIILPMSAKVENILLSRMEKNEEATTNGEWKVNDGSVMVGKNIGINSKNVDEQVTKKMELENKMISKCFQMLNGSTGVRECIDRAVSLQNPVIVYVVHKSLTSSSDIKLTTNDVVPLMFRRGVTPHDVYRYLLHTENPDIRLNGDFVRSEYISEEGSRIVIKKNKPINAIEQTVLKIYTAKISAWQKNGGGGGGRSNDTAPKKKSSNSKGNSGANGSSESGGRAEKRLHDRNKLIKKLHKSADRQGKNKGNKGTGQDRRTGNIG